MALHTDLISFWELDEASGTRSDSHGANHLTAINSPSGVSDPDGVMGTVLQLTAASSQGLNISDGSQTGLDVTSTWTINVWARRSATFPNGGGILLNKWYHGTYNQYLTQLTDSGEVTLGTDDTPSGYTYGFDSSSAGSVSSGTWHMVTITFSSGTATWYVDGTSIKTASMQTPANSSADFSIGYEAGRNVTYYDGYMSRASMWSRALSGGEVTSLYNGGAGLNYDGLFAAIDQEGYRWRNDDGTETTASWATGQDSGITQWDGVNQRLRVLLNTPDAPDGALYQLEYREQGVGDWIKISTTTSPTGQELFSTPGTHSFVVPAGVTSVCAVAVGGGGGGGTSTSGAAGGGGGGLGYRNNIAVTPGASITVVVGAGGAVGGGGAGGQSYFKDTSTAVGNGGAGNSGDSGGAGGSYVGDGGGNGGNAANSGSNGSGGGGAGGYSGNGGASGYGSGGSAGSGGGGGGGGGSGGTAQGGGGGVGLLGEGANGTAGPDEGNGGGGSGGAAGSNGNGGLYGGGGSGNDASYDGSRGNGGGGGVRVIWGTGRSFPSTLTADQPTAGAAVFKLVDSSYI